jgi:hypothetical protein
MPIRWPVRTGALLAALFAAILLLPGRAPAQSCTGDCSGDGQVTIEELVRGVAIALGDLNVLECPPFDANGDGSVSIDELVAAVDDALNGCALPAATATPTAEPNASQTPTPTPTCTDTPTPPSSATPTPTLEEGAISIADAVARDSLGGAIRLGESLTTEGVLTVDAGLFANGKLKVFAQSGGAGIMVYHQTSAAVPAFQAGERLRVSGVIRQADPSGGGDNPARGTVLIDLTDGSWSVLDTGTPLPTPLPVTLSEVTTSGTTVTGTLVRVASIHKVAGSNWPRFGDRSTEVTVGDDTGATLVVRFQRPIITPELDSRLQAIGDGLFSATAIVVQEDPDPADGLLSGYQLWPRGADDIDATAP